MSSIHEPNSKGYRKVSIGTSGGAVLGIDVGWSRRKPTTGLCLIKWENREIRLRFCKARHDRGDRRRKLNQLVNGERLLAVGVDGPLMKDLIRSPQHRPVDSLLSRGKFQHRGKAGSTKGGSGPKLHLHATELAKLVIENQKVNKATYPYRIHEKAVVEAFPNAFLAVLHPDKGFPSKPETARRWTDTLFPRVNVKQKLDQLLRDLLPQYKRGFNYDDIQDHENRASFLCALAALCVVYGRCVAVGDQNLGYIVLPPLQFWGESGTGTIKWAEDAIRDNCASVRSDFKDLTLYKDNKLWEPCTRIVSRRCTF